MRTHEYAEGVPSNISLAVYTGDLGRDRPAVAPKHHAAGAGLLVGPVGVCLWGLHAQAERQAAELSQHGRVVAQAHALIARRQQDHREGVQRRVVVVQVGLGYVLGIVCHAHGGISSRTTRQMQGRGATSLYAHKHKHVHTHSYARTHTHTHIHTHTHKYTHSYAHIHTYTDYAHL
jgi:hypothetical protein